MNTGHYQSSEQYPVYSDYQYGDSYQSQNMHRRNGLEFDSTFKMNTNNYEYLKFRKQQQLERIRKQKLIQQQKRSSMNKKIKKKNLDKKNNLNEKKENQ